MSAGLGVTVMDQVGLAQKGGSVVTHVRVGAAPSAISSNTIGSGKTDLLLACDMMTAADIKNSPRYAAGRTHAVVNMEEQLIGQFALEPDMQFPSKELVDLLHAATKHQSLVDMSSIARRLLGDSIASNMFALGYSYQKGLVPLRQDSITRAIELNGVAVAFNLQAFEWGRRAAEDLDAVRSLIEPCHASSVGLEQGASDLVAGASDPLEEMIHDRAHRPVNPTVDL